MMGADGRGHWLVMGVQQHATLAGRLPVGEALRAVACCGPSKPLGEHRGRGPTIGQVAHHQAVGLAAVLMHNDDVSVVVASARLYKL